MLRTTTATDGDAVGDADLQARRAVRQGVATMLPLIVGYIPFALVIGATAAELGTALPGWAGSWLIYGGSAHLTTLTTLDDAGLVAAVVTGILINARLLVYSTSLGQRWSTQPMWFRALGAALVIDPTWGVVERDGAVRSDREQRCFFLGAGLALGAAWSISIAVGAVLGARIDALDLDVVVPLCMLGLVAPALRDRRTSLVVLVAAAVALATASWPAGTGLLAAVVIAAGVGDALDRRAA